jgi:hypothetical protein
MTVVMPLPAPAKLTRLMLLIGALGLLAVSAPGSAWAATPLQCAQTAQSATPGVPSVGNPCWVDAPYPFGADGNTPGPGTTACGPIETYGPGWSGDENLGGISGNPPCYLQVTSMAFRSWNRGLAATGQPPISTYTGSTPFGVWLYNGTDWYPDPSFPGSGVCPGSRILWAGKLDYWLIGSSFTNPSTAGQTLCRFDGVNLVWEPFKIPPATIAKLPVNSSGLHLGGVNAGVCYAWNNCWFSGVDGIQVHWDGQGLTDVSTGPGLSPWLLGDVTASTGGVDPSGNAFGLAVTDTYNAPVGEGGGSLPAQPDGSPPPQLYGSQGGAFTPLSSTPPAVANPLTTNLVAVASDPSGDVWLAGDPANAAQHTPGQPAPLMPLAESGAAATCAGYGVNTFTFVPVGSAAINDSYGWNALAVFPNDGSALAGATYTPAGAIMPEPAIVHAVCGQPPALTTFTIPDPTGVQTALPSVAADAAANPAIGAISASASNDGWAATGTGFFFNADGVGGALRRRPAPGCTGGQ